MFYIGIYEDREASQCLAFHNTTLIGRSAYFYFFEILFFCLATLIDLPPQSISVPSIKYLLVIDLNTIVVLQTAIYIFIFIYFFKVLLRPNAHEFLD